MKTNLFKAEKTRLVVLLFFWAMPYVLLADGNPPVGAINGLFSVSATEQVYFSKGNLQYIGTASTPYWKFAENQWDYLGNNGQGGSSQAVDRDLFGWGTSGFNHGANCYQPWNTSETNSDYYAYGQYNYNLYDQSGMADWGYNAISNGGNQPNRWRTLTSDEWYYLINYRNTASGVRWVQARVNNVNGMIKLPDDWSTSYYSFNYPNVNSTEWGYNPISLTTWNMLEQHGAVFLPASGGRWSGGEIHFVTSLYWSSSCYDANQARALSFGNSTMGIAWRNRFCGGAVRLVRDADSYYYGVNTTANPTEGGTVVGAGDYEIGSTCTLIAVANEGYQFVNWTKDGTIVSTNENYSFVVTSHQTIVANFEIIPSSWPNGTLCGAFSVCDTLQVQFSQGNLQYQASTNTWRFAEHQYDYIGSANSNISQTYAGWIDLFGWATSGYNHGSVYYHPWDNTKSSSGYSAYGKTSYPQYNLYDQTGQADWGYNAISNGGDEENLWRTMTRNEWNYVLNTRPTVSGIRFVKALVNNVNGLILLPDDWNESTYNLINPNVSNASYSTNTLSSSEWNDLEQTGAVFLPAAGYREGTLIRTANGQGSYWSSSAYENSQAYYIYFNSSGMSVYYNNYDDGQSVRLVRPVMNTFFGINVSSNPASGGTITGSGEYEEGSTCTLTATPNEGYVFVNWTENGEVVSTDATYTFTVTGDRTLVANFTLNSYAITATANPTAGGTVTGAGNYDHGTTTTLTAIVNEGYTFVNWTENGNEVSTSVSYSFTVTEAKTFVANFNLNSYEITATANPTNGGTVTGAGSYDFGMTASLTATVAEGYTFVNWTENGNAVSTSATYSFTVTADRDLVANFSANPYTIGVSANPANCGTVTGGGTYIQGALCILTATANDGYTFVNWIENGEIISTETTYSFTVIENRTLVANFSEIVNHWEPEISEYEDNMTLTCIVQIDGVEQATTMLEVGAFCGTQCRGSQRATYFAPTDCYIFQMTIFGESNDEISFRLYDHQLDQELQLPPPSPIIFNANGYGSLINPYVLNFVSTVVISAEANPANAGTITGTGEYALGTDVTLSANANTGYQFVNWTLDGEVVSSNASYQFTVTEAANFVANFRYVHTQALNNGWNWWSTYIELNNNDGLSQLENSIGSAGIIIKSRTNGYVEAYQYNGETNWYGTLSSINNEQMYKIRTNAACNATVAGSLALPSSHPINIKNGWNWIGFPCNQNVNVDVAMSGFTPENNDVLKGRNGFTTYYSDGNYNMWYGTLNTLEPGKGYMYRSNSATQKTLVFQTGRGEATAENITPENNFYQPADKDFADNMTITAVLELDGEELRSEDYELSAFVGDECRGSVRLMYVEPVNRYVAFLTVFGEPSETLYFRLTDGTQTELSMDEITFAADGMEGTLSEPMTLRFGTTKLDENELSKVLVYPNPSNGVFNIQGQVIRKIEVFNAFGQAVVSEETSNDHLQIDLSRYADGCYLLRVVTDNGISNRQLIKK